MANPIIPGIPQTEQDLLYSKLNAYNQGRASYKEVGAYLVVLPRPATSPNILFVGFTLHCPEDSPSSTFASFPPTFTKRCGWQVRYASTRRAACYLWSTTPKECRVKGTTLSP